MSEVLLPDWTTVAPLPLPVWSTSELLCAKAGAAAANARIEALVRTIFFMRNFPIRF